MMHPIPFMASSDSSLLMVMGNRQLTIKLSTHCEHLKSPEVFRTCSGFKAGEKLAAYCGSAPSVYQSAGKLIAGHIIEHGSTYARRMPN